MYSINHLPRRARRAGISTLLASFTAFSLLSGMVPSASAASGLTVSIDDVAVTEGVDSAAVFTVTVSGRHPNQGITVDYETRDGNSPSHATAGLDYVATSGTLSIPASTATDDNLTGTISVPIIDDATHEPLETFNVKLLSSSVNIATGGGGTGTATITSKDPLPALRIRDAQVTEGNTSMIFTVDIQGSSNEDVLVDYATRTDASLDDAAEPQDFKAKSGTLTFPANSTAAQQIEVPIIDDNVYEGDERLFVDLSNSFNAKIARATATGVIVDDESKVVLSMTADKFTVDEGDTTHVTNVDVQLSGLAEKDVPFVYNTFDGQSPAAHKGSDYTEVTNGSGVVRAGSILSFVPVTILGDKNVEQDENFFVTISDPQGAKIGASTTQITLRNDDK